MKVFLWNIERIKPEPVIEQASALDRAIAAVDEINAVFPELKNAPDKADRYGFWINHAEAQVCLTQWKGYPKPFHPADFGVYRGNKNND